MSFITGDTEIINSVARLKEIGFAFYDKAAVKAVRHGGGLKVEKKDDTAVIYFSKKVEFFRGLSLLKENEDKAVVSVENSPVFENLVIMIDNSRSSVLSVEGFKSIVKILADLGYTGIQLYTEDTYEIPEEPYFGHMRGRLTISEIREMDEICRLFGIELIPCIQTLAHLKKIFFWDRFIPLNDLNDILLCEDEGTYDLIDKMFKALSSGFSSRKVNIGMDEAHLVGLGKYLDLNGYKNRFEILLGHLKKILEIAEKYGFKASMWSDMFFRLAYKGAYYPSPDAPDIPQSVIDSVPKNVNLIYWDYKHEEKAQYDDMIRRHKCFSNNIQFAGGAWRWKGFAPFNEIGMRRGASALQSCKDNGIKDVILTVWGDDGTECPIMAVLPQITLYSEFCYNGSFNVKGIKRRMASCAGAVYEDFLLLDSLNGERRDAICNPCKYLLYNDPMAGIFDYYADETMSAYYRDIARRLSCAKKRNPSHMLLFSSASALASLLSYKANLGNDIIKAYKGKDLNKLTEIAEKIIPKAVRALDTFLRLFRKQWLLTNKFFGLEIHSLRLGGLRQRLLDTKNVLIAYCKGKIGRLEELEQPRYPYFANNNDKTLCFQSYIMNSSVNNSY